HPPPGRSTIDPTGEAPRPTGKAVAVPTPHDRASPIEAKHVILATGARAKSLPGIALDGERIIEYRKAMTLPEQPKSIIVLGAGAIGVEFASFYRSLGTRVTIVEF